MAPIWALVMLCAVFQPAAAQRSYEPSDAAYGPSPAYSEHAGTPYLECADAEVPKGNDYYTAPQLLDVYDPIECNAFPRGYMTHGGQIFGSATKLAAETKFLSRFDSVCFHSPRKKGQPLSSFYSEQHPMAKYKRGARVCTIWPSMMRRSAEMPDGGLYILRSEKNPSSDETLSALLDHQVGGFSTPKYDRIVAFLGQSQFGKDDMKGYSNCPMFGQNAQLESHGASSDRLGIDACGQCFIVPYDLEPGIYTFYWYWRADEPEVEGYSGSGGMPEEYITCFDVRIEEGRVDECPLAGDNGQYPGNLPGTGRHAGEYKSTGYMTGGPTVPSSVVPCKSDGKLAPPSPKPVEPSPMPPSDKPPAPTPPPPEMGTTSPRPPAPSVEVTTSPATPPEAPSQPTPSPPPSAPMPPPSEPTPPTDPTPSPTEPNPSPSPDPVPPEEPAPPAEMETCMQQTGAEYGGDVVGAPLDVDSVGECCDACAATAGGSPSESCNTYVYCPPDSDPDDCEPRQCVLKNSQEVRPPVVTVNVFTSGTNCLTNPDGCMNPTQDECKVDNQTSRPGAGSTFNDASVLLVTAPSTCCSLCQRTPGCRSWACDGLNGGCALKMTVPQQVAIPNDRAFFSGVVDEEGVPPEILNEVLPNDTPCEVEEGVDFPGNDIELLTTSDAEECCRTCANHFNDAPMPIPDCFAWTWNTETSECSLKGKVANRTTGNELLVGATAF